MSAVDWSLVKFPVACGRCGEDLFGRDDAACPTCGLVLDWNEVIPLERLTCIRCQYPLRGLTGDHCPECGWELDWNEALTDHHHRQLPYFEFHWRRRPIRSAIATFRASLRPRLLWESLRLNNPPRLFPIALWALLGVAGMTVCLIFEHAWQETRFWMRFTAPLDVGTIILHYLSGLFEACFNPWTLEAVIRPAGVLGGWVISLLWPLFLFTQSLRLCRVRPRQMVRLWFYASAVPGLPLVVLVVLLHRRVTRWPGLQDNVKVDLGLLLSLLAMALFLLRSLWIALARYIRMKHAFWVALATHVIAALMASVLYIELMIL